VQGGLALEDVQPRGGDAPRAQRFGQRRVVDDAAARDIGQRGVAFICASSAAPIVWWLSAE
jgi:hypothetical protein